MNQFIVICNHCLEPRLLLSPKSNKIDWRLQPLRFKISNYCLAVRLIFMLCEDLVPYCQFTLNSIYKKSI